MNNEGPKTWKVVLLCAVVVLIMVGVPIGVWAFRVGTAPIKGDGDTVIMNEDARNRTAAHAKLLEKYAAVKNADAAINQFAKTQRAQPNSLIAQTNLDGAITGCKAAASDYDAEAKKILSRDWLDASLPRQINTNDPDTDCRENEQ